MNKKRVNDNIKEFNRRLEEIFFELDIDNERIDNFKVNELDSVNVESVTRKYDEIGIIGRKLKYVLRTLHIRSHEKEQLTEKLKDIKLSLNALCRETDFNTTF